MMKKIFLVAGLVSATVVPALAQPVPPPPPVAPVAPPAPMIHVMPMGDRVLTRQEVQALVQTHFARLDSNKDGVVAGDELATGPRRHRGDMAVERSPLRIVREEGGRDPGAAFDRLDINKDGMISRDEFAKGREMRIEKRIVMNKDGKRGPMKMRMHRLGGMGMGGGHLIKLADNNKDGRVTLQEATAGALAFFDKVDTNRDGHITRDERRSNRGKMREIHVIRS